MLCLFHGGLSGAASGRERMTEATGATGPLQARFEDGLRFLATALALGAAGRSEAAAVSAALDALRCFLAVLEAAAARHLPDPDGDVSRLHDQCVALLTLHQDAPDAARHALEAAQLARDVAARLLPMLVMEGGDRS